LASQSTGGGIFKAARLDARPGLHPYLFSPGSSTQTAAPQ
jgi:hypothetical protein